MTVSQKAVCSTGRTLRAPKWHPGGVDRDQYGRPKRAPTFPVILNRRPKGARPSLVMLSGAKHLRGAPLPHQHVRQEARCPTGKTGRALESQIRSVDRDPHGRQQRAPTSTIILSAARHLRGVPMSPSISRQALVELGRFRLRRPKLHDVPVASGSPAAESVPQSPIPSRVSHSSDLSKNRRKMYFRHLAVNPQFRRHAIALSHVFLCCDDARNCDEFDTRARHNSCIGAHILAPA
jgi:hypothetical protein